MNPTPYEQSTARSRRAARERTQQQRRADRWAMFWSVFIATSAVTGWMLLFAAVLNWIASLAGDGFAIVLAVFAISTIAGLVAAWIAGEDL